MTSLFALGMEAIKLVAFISLVITNVLHCAEADKCSEATKAYNECSEKYKKFKIHIIFYLPSASKNIKYFLCKELTPPTKKL